MEQCSSPNRKNAHILVACRHRQCCVSEWSTLAEGKSHLSSETAWASSTVVKIARGWACCVSRSTLLRRRAVATPLRPTSLTDASWRDRAARFISITSLQIGLDRTYSRLTEEGNACSTAHVNDVPFSVECFRAPHIPDICTSPCALSYSSWSCLVAVGAECSFCFSMMPRPLCLLYFNEVHEVLVRAIG